MKPLTVSSVLFLCLVLSGCACAEAPVLVTEKDGVRVYRGYDDHGNRYYFTTPSGDVEWTEQQQVGKTSVPISRKTSSGVHLEKSK
jgi:hypothetical protein